MKHGTLLKNVEVKTLTGQYVYYGADGKVVAQAIVEANMNKLSMTMPIWVDSEYGEVQFTLANIVSVTSNYYLPTD